MARVYDTTSATLYRLAVLVTGDPRLAEVVTQPAYLEVWRHPADL